MPQRATGSEQPISIGSIAHAAVETASVAHKVFDLLAEIAGTDDDISNPFAPKLPELMRYKRLTGYQNHGFRYSVRRRAQTRR